MISTRAAAGISPGAISPGLLHTATVIRRAVAVGSLVAVTGCLPEAGRPGYDFDGGSTIALDVPRFEFPSVPDQGPVDLGAPVDRGVGGDVGPALDAGRVYPRGPYGVSAGQVFAPFVLASCAGGGYAFDGPEWVSARASVVALNAGWCSNCAGAAQAAQAIDTEYRDRGVRVLQVLVEGSAPEAPPDSRFCSSWRTQNAISHPMLLDLGGMLSGFWNPTALPVLVLVDADGRIVSVAGGNPQGVAVTRAAVDNTLTRSP